MTRVLVIEDNEQNRYLAAFVLERAGHTVFQAATGVAGVELAREVGPELVLLDIRLPDGDGLELARRLRALPELAKVPIIAVSAHAMVGDRERGLAEGLDHYIEKPYEPEVLLEAVERFAQG